MELKIEYLPVSALTPYNKNTRKHEKKDIDNIAESIHRYGMNDAIGIWGEQNIIVEGHGRMLACKQLGMTEVPCVRLDHLTDEQRREYAIAHNATAELSEWDLDILPDEFAELDFDGFDFSFSFESFSEEDIDFRDSGTYEKHSEYDDEAYSPDPVDSDLLERFKGHENEFLLKRRVIITYAPEREPDICRLLGVEKDSLKIVYDIEELLGEQK